MRRTANVRPLENYAALGIQPRFKRTCKLTVELENSISITYPHVVIYIYNYLTTTSISYSWFGSLITMFGFKLRSTGRLQTRRETAIEWSCYDVRVHLFAGLHLNFPLLLVAQAFQSPSQPNNPMAFRRTRLPLVTGNNSDQSKTCEDVVMRSTTG